MIETQQYEVHQIMVVSDKSWAFEVVLWILNIPVCFINAGCKQYFVVTGSRQFIANKAYIYNQNFVYTGSRT